VGQQSTYGHGPNNSFKPTPCRGIGHVLYATLAHVRCPVTGRLNSGVRCLGKQTVDPVIHFETIKAIHTWLLPVLVLAVLAIRRPRKFWLRCIIAVLIGWIYTVLFTLFVYNPAGIAAGHALGEHFPENRYDNNTSGIAIVFGWLLPAIYTAAAAVLRAVWLRVSRHGT
jgi:hypothetical protein